MLLPIFGWINFQVKCCISVPLAVWSTDRYWPWWMTAPPTVTYSALPLREFGARAARRQSVHRRTDSFALRPRLWTCRRDLSGTEVPPLPLINLNSIWAAVIAVTKWNMGTYDKELANNRRNVHMAVIRLHRMHQMQTIVTDVRGVCLSVSLFVTRLNSASLQKRLNTSRSCLE